MVKTRKKRNYKGGGLWNPFAKKPTDPQKLCVFENQNIIDLFNNMNAYADSNMNANADREKYPYFYVKYIKNEIIRKGLTNITDEADRMDPASTHTQKYLSDLYNHLTNHSQKNFTFEMANEISKAIVSCNSNNMPLEDKITSTIYYIHIAITKFNLIHTRLWNEELEQAKATAMSKGGKRKTKKTRKTQKKSRKC